MMDARVGVSAAERRYRRFAAGAALLSAAAALVYAIAFVVLRNEGVAAMMLTTGGLLSAAALFGLYGRIRAGDVGFAELGLVLGLAGTLGAAIHGGYDLANVLNPPAAGPDLPHAVDPRGFLTFGVSGLGILALSEASLETTGWPRALSILGFVLGATLIVVYLGRLIVLDATSPVILVPAAAGFFLGPAWYGWLGRELLRHRT